MKKHKAHSIARLTATLVASACFSTMANASVGDITIDDVSLSYISGQAIGSDESENVVIQANESSKAINNDTSGEVINVRGVNISLSGSYSGENIRTKSGAKTTIGSELTQTVGINTDGDAINAIGNSAKIDINAKNIVINADGAGIWAQNNTEFEDMPKEHTTVNIISENLIINAGSTGITAYSNSEVNITGNVEINSKDGLAIDTRGYSTININQSSDKKVVLNGNILFETDDSGTSGKIIDSNVNINLTNAESVWNGRSLVEVPESYTDDKDKTVTNLNLKLTNGAKWNVAGDSFVNNLSLDGGVLNITEANQTVNVQTLKGSGGVVTVASKVEEDGSISTGKLNVGNVAQIMGVDTSKGTAEGQLNVNFTGITSDDFGKNATEKLAVLENNINITGATQTQNVSEGLVNGELSRKIDTEGVVTKVIEKENTVTKSLQNIASMNFLTFRSQMNDLDKRMGDLRNMPQSDGMWARAVAGQSKYKDMHTDYKTLQIGADHRIGNFYIGGALNYTDGDGDTHNAKTDDKNFGIGIYGGWLGDDGQFVDVIIKRFKAESDYDAYYANGLKGSGSYDTWGTSASVEYGWRLGIGQTNYYVEPQAELMIGHLNSVGYKTHSANGDVLVHQDGVKTVVGRLGMAAGWVSPDKLGSVYVKASILNDWQGDSRIRTSMDGTLRTSSEDMGGTWGEFAIGGTWNMTKNVSAYGEIETTAGNPVNTTYQASAGIRYSF